MMLKHKLVEILADNMRFMKTENVSVLLLTLSSKVSVGNAVKD